MVWFTNECLHSGGPNDMDDMVYRPLFAYMASCPSNIPWNGVSKYSWTNASKDVVISDMYNTNKSRRMAELDQTHVMGTAACQLRTGVGWMLFWPEYLLDKESTCLGKVKRKKKSRHGRWRRTYCKRKSHARHTPPNLNGRQHHSFVRWLDNYDCVALLRWIIFLVDLLFIVLKNPM